MAIERTLSIIKPDGVERNLIGKIIARFEESGLHVVASRMQMLSRHEAEGFYAVHKARPFFGELVSSMCSGPVLLMVLEGDNAILKNREIMGATNPSDAKDGTIRKLYAKSIGENTVHGSDAPETAHFEIQWFFKGSEVCSRR
jgi:nucleoside-diphosphate kinase